MSRAQPAGTPERLAQSLTDHKLAQWLRQRSHRGGVASTQADYAWTNSCETRLPFGGRADCVTSTVDQDEHVQGGSYHALGSWCAGSPCPALLMESEKLQEQAAHNTKEQFAASPDLASEILSAVMDALTAHTAMSKQALESEKLRADMQDVLLGAGKLWEGLRAKAGRDGAATRG